MGPRLFRRGNVTPQYIISYRPQGLQWGHVFSDVEIIIFDSAAEDVRVASMGPRLFRRGNSGP